MKRDSTVVCGWPLGRLVLMDVRAPLWARMLIRGMDAMSVRINGLTFDRANCDVLNLACGTTNNALRIIERDGHAMISLPHAVQIGPKELAAGVDSRSRGRIA